MRADFRSSRGPYSTRQGPRGCSLEGLEPRRVLSGNVGAATALIASPSATPAATPLATISYPGAVTVSANQITTEDDIIPRFVASPTVTNVKGGNWSDPKIWSSGRVPTT